MTINVILWIYVAFLLAGGLMGYVKARSKVSLVTSLIFGALIALCALGLMHAQVAPVLIGLLIVVFSIRLAKTRKFMPAGLMTIVSAVALVCILALGLWR